MSRRSSQCVFSWGVGGVGAVLSNVYHGDGFVSESFGKTTGISAMRLYLGGWCVCVCVFNEGGGLGVERAIVDVQRSARKPRGFPPLARLPPEPS